MTLSIAGSGCALASPANLFGYTQSNAGYSISQAGVINGEATGSPTAFTSSIKIPTGSGLTGDAALFNFYQGNESRLVLRQYTYSTTDLRPNQIIDPHAASWTPPLTSQTWNSVANMHAVATKGNYLYATGYDLGKIAVVNMNNGYAQTTSYQFPTAWPAIPVPSGASVHGEALTVVGSNLYALFTVNPDGGYSSYADSIVVKFNINALNGTLTYVNYLNVGKNAFTLDYYNNKLYVCALGGMQNAGSSNAETKLDVINLTNFTKTSVSKTAAMTGDFRDIAIADANHAYVFLGNYDSSWNMEGGIYCSTVANLNSPSLWTKVSNVNDAGYLWGIHADSSRLWFVKGDKVDIYAGLPTGAATAARTFTAAQLGDATGHLNSATILAPDKTTTGAFGTLASSSASASEGKTFAAHAILAQQARRLAEEKAAK